MAESKFLEIPDLVLEKIFSHLDPKELLQLTRCNKFLKDYVENNPRLMSCLKLKIFVNFDGSIAEEDQEKFEICMNSTRKYRSMSLTVRRDVKDFVLKGSSDSDSDNELSDNEESDESSGSENESGSANDCLESSDEKELNEEKSESDETSETSMLNQPELCVKSLIDKHASTIKSVEVYIKTRKHDFLFEIFQCLRNLSNVEEVAIQFTLTSRASYFGESHDDCMIDNKNVCTCGNAWLKVKSKYRKPIPVADEFTHPFNFFEHLKKLKIVTETSAVFCLFGSCKSIETLELAFGMADLDLTGLFSTISNCRASLKTLKVSSYRSLPINVRYIEDLFYALNINRIDLTSLHLSLPHVKFGRIQLLIDFLVTQKNLQCFIFTATIDNFVKYAFNNILGNLVKLKYLTLSVYEGEESIAYDIDDGNSSDDDGNARQPPESWNLQNLEELSIRYWTTWGTDFPYEIFGLFSDKLKKIDLGGYLVWWRNEDTFKNIVINYESLVELKVSSCVSHGQYSSNEIFRILKFLKKLKILKFSFPSQDTSFNPKLFRKNEDLNLPVIDDVDLWFNKSIKTVHVVKLMKLMSNMSKFNFNRWNGYSDDFMETVIKELPNLTDLNFPNACTFGTKASFWLKMQSDVQKYNKNPDMFKVAEAKLEYFIKQTKIWSK